MDLIDDFNAFETVELKTRSKARCATCSLESKLLAAVDDLLRRKASRPIIAKWLREKHGINMSHKALEWHWQNHLTKEV